MDISETTKAQAKREIDAEVRQLFALTFPAYTVREDVLIGKWIEERARFLNVQDAIRRMPV